MDVKLENSVLLLYGYEILVSISHVCESRPPALYYLMQSGGPQLLSGGAPGRKPAGPGPAWILTEKDAHLKPLGTNFTIQGRVTEETVQLHRWGRTQGELSCRELLREVLGRRRVVKRGLSWALPKLQPVAGSLVGGKQVPHSCCSLQKDETAAESLCSRR